MRKNKYALSICAFILLFSAGLAFAETADAKVIKFINEACRALSEGEYDNCISICERAIRANPHCAAAYYTRGFAYRYKGCYDEALSDFDKTIEIDPEYAAAYYGRAKCYFHKEDCENAWISISKAKKMGFKDIEASFLDELKRVAEPLP